MRPLRLFHTVRHLKPVQVYGRLLRRLPAAIPIGPTPPLRARAGAWTPPVPKPRSLIGKERIRLLNRERDIASSAIWTDPSQEALWLYNLHYFDDLASQGGDAARQADLVTRWIAENPPRSGVGWDPYPTSLRIVNWIRWALGGATLEPRALASLALQARHLERRIEWHLLGNHLIANAKALAFAGAVFDGPQAKCWLERGLAILEQELPRQILGDGGHGERSPMYHAIVLEDLLDLVNVTRAHGLPEPERWKGTIAAMRKWLAAMVHPDGGIAFYNDAAFGVAADRNALEAYADRLGLPPVRQPGRPLHHLEASGYARLSAEDAVLILDAAPVGEDHLCGHAHADTLSFELSLGQQRLIVNGGTSRYGAGPERQRQRGTAAHSTVALDGADSSEVWGGFRVARRARILATSAAIDGDAVSFEAAHDGYRRLPGRPVHRRRWRLDPAGLRIEDAIEGGFATAVARFHLAPGIVAQVDAGGLAGSIVLPGGRRVRWSSSASGGIEPSQWHPEFGLTMPTSCLRVPFTSPRLSVAFAW